MLRRAKLIMQTRLRELERGEAAELASSLGISEQYLSDLRLGRRDITEAVTLDLSKLK